jgi:hypothetical protein
MGGEQISKDHFLGWVPRLICPGMTNDRTTLAICFNALWLEVELVFFRSGYSLLDIQIIVCFSAYSCLLNIISFLQTCKNHNVRLDVYYQRLWIFTSIILVSLHVQSTSPPIFFIDNN